MQKVITTILISCYFLVPLAFWLKHFHPFAGIKDFVFAASSIAAFCVLLASFVLDGKIKLKKNKGIIFVLLFYLYNLLSFTLQAYTDPNDFFLLSTLVMLALAASYAVDVKGRDKILHALIFASLISSVYSILQFFGIDFLGLVHYFGSRSEIGSRTFSFFGNPNLLGGFCVFILPIMLAFLLESLKTRKKIWGLRVSAVYGLVLGLTFLMLLMSQARGSWVAWFLSMALFALLYYRDGIASFYRKNNLRVWVIVGIIAIAGLSTLTLTERR